MPVTLRIAGKPFIKSRPLLFCLHHAGDSLRASSVVKREEVLCDSLCEDDIHSVLFSGTRSRSGVQLLRVRVFPVLRLGMAANALCLMWSKLRYRHTEVQSSPRQTDELLLDHKRTTDMQPLKQTNKQTSNQTNKQSRCLVPLKQFSHRLDGSNHHCWVFY